MIKPVENPIGRIGSRTGDLQDRSAVPQPNALPRAPSALLVEEFMICYSEGMCMFPRITFICLSSDVDWSLRWTRGVVMK